MSRKETQKVFFYRTSNYYLGGTLLLATLAGFIYLVRLHNRLLKNKQHSSELPKSPAEIRERQDAVEELAARPAWRQRFMAEAMVSAGLSRNPEPLFQWVNM